jgi:hypothetical protein
MIMAKTFITSEYDKFKNKTTVECAYPFIIQNAYNTATTIRFRHLKTPSYNSLVLDALHIGSDWMFIRDGDIIFNIDNKHNITLQPHENFTNTLKYNLNIYSKTVQVNLKGSDSVHCEESVYYEFPVELLKSICDAQSVDIRISGDSTYISANANQFILYCQKFYNAVIDSNAYVESVNKSFKGSGCMLTLGLIVTIFTTALMSIFKIIN